MKFALLAAIALLIGCGGGKTTASKSAAAFDEAPKTAAPVAAAHPHTEADHTSMPAMDHTTMPAMDHSAMPSMDHSKMDHASMPSMDHSKMDHSAMPSMDHSKMDHASMPAMDHSKMDHSTMPSMQHMQHGSSPRPAVLAPPSPPTTTDPVETLRPDEFDAPPPHGEDS